MVSIAEADKETLLNYLGDQLLLFILPNEDTPTDGNLMGPTHLTEEELDELFIGAFDEFKDESEGTGIELEKATNLLNNDVYVAKKGYHRFDTKWQWQLQSYQKVC